MYIQRRASARAHTHKHTKDAVPPTPIVTLFKYKPIYFYYQNSFNGNIVSQMQTLTPPREKFGVNDEPTSHNLTGPLLPSHMNSILLLKDSRQP